MITTNSVRLMIRNFHQYSDPRNLQNTPDAADVTSYIYLFKFTSFHGSDGSETNHVTSVITKHREDFFPDLNRDLINIVYSCDLGGIGTSEKRRFRRHPTVRLYSQLTQGQEILEPCVSFFNADENLHSFSVQMIVLLLLI